MPTAYRSGINLTAALTPSLSSVSAAALSSVSARVSYTTNHAYGTVWVLVNTSATATVSEIKAGTELANSVAGAQTHDVSSLTASTTYYAHVHFEFGLESSTRHTTAFNTPATGGGSGGVIYRAGITVTGALDSLVSVSDSTAGATITFETGGAYDLTVDAPTVTYGGVALTSVTVTDANTFTAVMPIDGFAFGSENDFIVTVDGVALNAISEPFLSDLGAYVALSVAYSELHPDSPLKRAEVTDLYSGLVAGDQVPYDPLTAGTAAEPSGYAVTVTSTGQVNVAGAGAEPEPVYVTFGLVDASDGYARSQDETTNEYFSVWTIYTSIPDGELTLGTVLTTDTTATVPGTWTGTNATGFQRRIGAGSWVAFATFPFVVTGLTASTAYTVDVRPVNGTVPGDIVSTSFTTGAASGVDTTPDAFAFTDQPAVPLSTATVSNSVQVAGVTAGQDIAVTVTGGEWSYSTDAGTTWSGWTSSGGNVRLNYLLRVRHTSSGSYGTAVNTVLTVGGVSDTFTTTTTTDTVAPVITLTGGNRTLTVGEDWNDPGYSATDAVAGDLTDDVVITGAVDTNTPGTYTLTYTVEDAAGNVGTAQRTVTVAASAAGLQIDSAPASITRYGTFELVVSGAVEAPTVQNTVCRVNGDQGPQVITTAVTGSGPWTIEFLARFDLPIQFNSVGYPLYVTVGDETVQTERIPMLSVIPYVNVLSVATGSGTIHDVFPQWELGVGDQIVHLAATRIAGVPVAIDSSGTPRLLGPLLVNDSIWYRVIKADGTVSTIPPNLEFTFTADSDVEYIRDVVPRLLATDANLVRVFLDHDNTVRVRITHDGTAINMEQFSRFVLSGFPVDIDSDDNPEVFDVTEGNGVLDLMLGQLLTSPGVYKLRLIGYSQLHTNGVVLFDPSLVDASVTAIVMNA